MEAPCLYRVTRERIPQLAKLFAEAFLEDPLYRKLIPVKSIRQKALLRYFSDYLYTYQGNSQIYADSPELLGAVVVLDPQNLKEDSSPRGLFLNGIFIGKLLWLLFTLDPTGKTALSFYKNRRYLTSKWVDFLGGEHMHIDFLAVSPKNRGKGIASALVKPLLDYADHTACHTTLETHNPKNLGLYRHLGFEVVEKIGEEQSLCQYCLER